MADKPKRTLSLWKVTVDFPSVEHSYKDDRVSFECEPDPVIP